MLESRDFVINPEIAYSPEQLHLFLLSELGANLFFEKGYPINALKYDIANLLFIDLDLRVLE